MAKPVAAFIGVVALIAVVIVVLATGGAGPGDGGEGGEDVQLGEGPGAPEDVTPADIAEATVTKEGSDIQFVAEMASEIPMRVEDGSLEFRWDVSENGNDTWIVSSTINVAVTAALTSQQTPYGSSTIDGTMPGEVTVRGTTLTIRFDASKVKGFPGNFEWRLKTTLDADRADPKSAVATDTAPDSGPGRVGN